MKKSIKTILLVAIIMVLFTSCAHVNTCVKGTKVYGFWNGLWHGIIAGFTFIGKLFNHDIAVYAVNNNGCWYDFGFLLGVGAWAGDGTKIVYKKK